MSAKSDSALESASSKGAVPSMDQMDVAQPENLQQTKVQLLAEIEGCLTDDGYTQDKINELSSIRGSLIRKGFINKEDDDNLLLC
tara:strand:- start:305 stop:559 length:255 start_codon:yes stop_codon:yes gene_type:complete